MTTNYLLNKQKDANTKYDTLTEHLKESFLGIDPSVRDAKRKHWWKGLCDEQRDNIVNTYYDSY